MDPIHPDLLKKTREALVNSGFPLELRMMNGLEKKGWYCKPASHFLDFETNKFRENDIISQKTINGIDITLFIECKRSDNKQLILYQPKKSFKNPFSSLYVQMFPRINNNYEVLKNIKSAFAKFPAFSQLQQFSNSIIFTKGDKVEQDNVSFFQFSKQYN